MRRLVFAILIALLIFPSCQTRSDESGFTRDERVAALRILTADMISSLLSDGAVEESFFVSQLPSEYTIYSEYSPSYRMLTDDYTSELSSITSRCRTAQLYLEGSQRTLNGFGAKIVGAAFTGLDVMIRLKLAEYRLKIQNCENRISSLERSIDSINSMIDTARILPGRRMRVGIRRKTFWKRTFAVFLASVCLWSAAGCTGAGTGMDREDEKVSTELTQRQRELLEEMGLPADYDKLTDTQKNAVTSIEAMLSYLESKYQEEFCYLSYAEAGTLEKEHLEAYPASGTPSDIGVRPLYESRVREFAVQSFPESGIKVFSDIRNLGQGTDGQSVTEENVLQTASAVTYIFISESVCTEAQLRDFTEECAQWMESQCQGVAAQICLRLTDAAQWELIDATGYEDKLRADIFTAEAECAISASGKVTVY